MKKFETSYLLVGYSVAAWWCIRGIRDYDPVKSIWAFTDEKCSYSRPLITYKLGKRIDSMTYRGKIFQSNDVDVRYEFMVKHLDGKRKIAILSDESEVFFDKALIATGGTPIIPEISGREVPGVFTFTRQNDMERIDDFLRKNPIDNIVILGGGFIGLKTCEALMDLNKNITLVELAPRLLQNMMDDEGSLYLEKSLAQSGVHIIKEDTVVSFTEEKGRLHDVLLKSGHRIPADVAVISIGVRPHIDWLRSSGIKINKGILVNEFQETSVPGIFAAGDVAETRNLLTGQRNVVATWPEAVNQGRIAGWNMSGQSIAYLGSLPMNAVEIGEKAMVSAGLVNPVEKGYEVVTQKDRDNYKKLVLKDNLIVGVIFLGEIEKSGIYIHLMRQKLSVESFRHKLLNPHFGLINLPTNYRKHLVKGAGIEV